GDGLGIFVDGSQAALRFSHGGRNQGFDSFMIAYASAGKGAVIMMNANDSGTGRAIVNAIAQQYGWSGGISLIPPGWKLRDLLRVVIDDYPNVVLAAVGISCGLAVVFVAASRIVLRRYSLRRTRT